MIEIFVETKKYKWTQIIQIQKAKMTMMREEVINSTVYRDQNYE